MSEASPGLVKSSVPIRNLLYFQIACTLLAVAAVSLLIVVGFSDLEGVDRTDTEREASR